MAPARHTADKLKSCNNKISAKLSGNIDTRLRPSCENRSEMDLKKTVMVDVNKPGAQDSAEMMKKEPWFEDKLPGDGKAENSFSVLYNSTSSWESELETSKNKSWFDLVEEDEADVENQSSNHEDKSNREQGTTENSIVLPGIKIKEEVLNEFENEEHVYEATTLNVPVPTDLPVVIKQEKNLEIAPTKCMGVSSSPKQDKCAVVKEQKKSSEKTYPQVKLEEKPMKEEKRLQNAHLKRERNSPNVERVDSKSSCQRGKKIKREIVYGVEKINVQSPNKNEHCADDNVIKQITNELDKERMKIKVDSNSKCLNYEDDSDTSMKNRKRALDTSIESVNIKRERNTSSSSSSNNSSVTQVREYERDPEVIARRQKQIDYGKNTIGYDRYRQQIPKEMRTTRHPRTPPKHVKYSRRGWDGTVKIWRQQLHAWDPASEMGNVHDSVSDTSLEVGSITSDDNISDCPEHEHPLKLSSSTPSGSVDNIDNGDYLNIDGEDLDHLLE